jgi:uncharacterized coiled-coil protein SlyX
MTEEQIERLAERKMDVLDRRYIEREMTEAEYQAAVMELNRWVERQYRTMDRGAVA